MLQKLFSLAGRLPTIVWVFLFPLGIIALITTIIFLFTALTHIEGFATIIFLVIGWLCAWGSVNTPEAFRGEKHATEYKVMVAGIICFYALMGMAIDQPGNYFFNKPLEVFFCPVKTTLQRGVDVTHPLPGRTDITQNFRCVDGNNRTVSFISPLQVIPVRFVEYVIVAYVLIGLAKLFKKTSMLEQTTNDGSQVGHT